MSTDKWTEGKLGVCLGVLFGMTYGLLVILIVVSTLHGAMYVY